MLSSNQLPPDQESVTTDTRAIVAEAVDLPESMPGGDLLTQQQELEHQLQESQSEQSGDSIRTAAVLRKLGKVLVQTGDLKQAMRYLHESLRMKRSLHGDGDHRGIAVTLYQLGEVSAQTGDLEQAMWYLQESLRMQRSLHGDGDHPGIAVTLHELGNVLAQTGDLKQAMRYLQESLRMKRSLHGDGDHPGIAVTLHEPCSHFAQAWRCVGPNWRPQAGHAVLARVLADGSAPAV